MGLFYPALLVVAAFCLGFCPFSLWVGRFFLGKDIRDYGDGNPGAANVFRAGGRKSGCLAALLDAAKGMPFVALAHWYFTLPEPTVQAVAFGAILGNAFSPFLGFKGGKSIAVTVGTLLALPHHEAAIAFAAFTLLSFLFIENDAWTVIAGLGGTLLFLVTTGAGLWPSLFVLAVLVLLAKKHMDELRAAPRFTARPIGWFQSRKRLV